eukprot:scaffold1955_cov254-Pinguiococcus_pyrenoidosus.AAC.3
MLPGPTSCAVVGGSFLQVLVGLSQRALHVDSHCIALRRVGDVAGAGLVGGACDVGRNRDRGLGGCGVGAVGSVEGSLHVDAEDEHESAGRAQHDGQAADQRGQQQRVGHAVHHDTHDRQDHDLVDTAENVARLGEVVAHVAREPRQEARARQQRDLHGPQQVLEDAAAAAAELLNLHGDPVGDLLLALHLVRRHQRRDGQDDDVEEGEEGDNLEHVVHGHADFLQLAILEDAPHAVQLGDQRDDGEGEGHVEHARRHRASGPAFVTHQQEAADVEHEAAEHAHGRELRLRQADDGVLAEVQEPHQKRGAHGGPDGREGYGGLAEGTVPGDEGTLRAGPGLRVLAADPFDEAEAHHVVGVRVAALVADAVVGGQAAAQHLRRRRSGAAARVGQGLLGGVGAARSRVSAPVDEAEIAVGLEEHAHRAGEPLDRLRAERLQQHVEVAGVLSLGDGGVGGVGPKQHGIVQESGFGHETVVEGVSCGIDDVGEAQGVLRDVLKGRGRADGREAVVREHLFFVVHLELLRKNLEVQRGQRRRHDGDGVVEGSSGLGVRLDTPALWPASPAGLVAVGLDVEEEVLVAFQHAEATRRQHEAPNVSAVGEQDDHSGSGLLQRVHDLDGVGDVLRTLLVEGSAIAQPHVGRIPRSGVPQEGVGHLAVGQPILEQQAEVGPVGRLGHREEALRQVHRRRLDPRGVAAADEGVGEEGALGPEGHQAEVEVVADGRHAQGRVVAARADVHVHVELEADVHEGRHGVAEVASRVVPDPLELRVAEQVTARIDVGDEPGNRGRQVPPVFRPSKAGLPVQQEAERELSWRRLRTRGGPRQAQERQRQQLARHVDGDGAHVDDAETLLAHSERRRAVGWPGVSGRAQRGEIEGAELPGA